MKNIYKLFIAVICVILTGCNGYLEINPKGAIADGLITGNSELVDGFVTAAYAYVPNLGYAESHNPWMHGSIRSDDTYKGGGGISDQLPWHEFETFAAVTANTGNNDGPWYRGYCAVSRCNTAINLLRGLELSEMPERDIRIAEMRFLRGAVYFNMKLFWRYIPWIGDEISNNMEEVLATPNVPEDGEMSLWKNILDDFEYAAQNLEITPKDKGRITRIAAKAMAAKTLLFMAYEQDDRHQFTSLNRQRLENALQYLNEITAMEGDVVTLCEDFADNFLPEYDNATKESIWEVQYSIADGTNNGGRINWGDELNAPWWVPHFSCCDFHKVSFNLANAFRTDVNGLPLFDTFNEAELKNNYSDYFNRNTFDPRFSHTVAVPGHPFKYDATLPYDSTGSRDPAIYGYMNSLKEQVHPDCDCVLKPFYVQNSMNKRNIRYAEVLLWKAEVLIQLDRYQEALPIINKIRKRASESMARLKWDDGAPVLNYKISLYEDGINCTWTKDFAWKVLQWENRLETACEGRRFFDLLRWGALEKTMNDYFAKERTRYNWMNNAHFSAGRDEYKPIPQAQINWSKGLYKQNPGY
ncbi:MAG: RagB/SusD family nutrient uptake outer membrane protein [Tannerella sp.]|jgi:hypothetical protein|nr:RagB/SusD family nutrient uptake outer membrane protein [Tannerella sp.]